MNWNEIEIKLKVKYNFIASHGWTFKWMNSIKICDIISEMI
jgi:hypothetical protein